MFASEGRAGWEYQRHEVCKMMVKTMKKQEKKNKEM